MAQQHLQRLTAVDASFLANESPSSHMHVGALVVLEGPPPPFEEFLDSLRSRLHLVPRYRQKLAHPPMDSGRPLWVDDPDFNLEYHVRQTALPKPGSEEQLMRLAARIMSQQLDRTQAAVGDVARRGPRGRGRRADLQDAPRPHRRHQRRRPRPGDVRPRPGSRRPARGHRRARALDPNAGADGRRARRRRRRGPRARRDRPRGRRARRARAAPERAAPRAGGRRGHRRDRVGGTQPGTGHAAERRDRAPPPLRRRALPSSPTSSSSRTASAAPSTTSS